MVGLENPVGGSLTRRGRNRSLPKLWRRGKGGKKNGFVASPGRLDYCKTTECRGVHSPPNDMAKEKGAVMEVINVIRIRQDEKEKL